MASKYLKRIEVAYPQQPNPRYMYAVQIIEAPDIETLQALTNEFLFTLPDTTPIWAPHLIDTQMLQYGTGAGLVFVMKITLYISGTQLTPPIPNPIP
jgi:hypothetical protein